MASHLKWQFGFEWWAVSFLTFGVASALLTRGALRLVGMAVAASMLGLMVHQYRKWNAAGWRRVHFRSMLAFRTIADRHRSRAAVEGRPFDMGAACGDLALLLCGEHNRAAAVAMTADLVTHQGSYLAGVFERHWRDVLPSASVATREDVVQRLRGRRLGPELVIAAAIENTYGARETARYAMALAAGDAS